MYVHLSSTENQTNNNSGISIWPEYTNCRVRYTSKTYSISGESSGGGKKGFFPNILVGFCLFSLYEY